MIITYSHKKVNAFAKTSLFYTNFIPFYTKLHNLFTIANTLNMKKYAKLCSLLLFFPFFFTISCHKTLDKNTIQTPQEQPAQNQIVQEQPTQAEEPFLPKKNQTNTPTPSTDVWDISQVDISHIQPTRKLIALTFDDSPNQTMESLLAVFAAFNERNPDCVAHATFFCNGNRITPHSFPTLSMAYAMQMELGNHSYSHADLPTLTLPEIQQEIEKTNVLLQRIDKRPAHLFRAPYGNLDERVRAQAHAPVFNWTIDTLDWLKQDETYICDKVLNGAFDGAICLLHDGFPPTVQSLKSLLPKLKEQGYQVVSLSELIKAQKRTLKNGVEYVRVTKKSG